MADTSRFFTAKQIADAAQEAVDNWDFDVELDNGLTPEYIAVMKEALRFDEEDAQALWCEDGPMDLDSAYGDIWDFLDEFAKNTASQI